MFLEFGFQECKASQHRSWKEIKLELGESADTQHLNIRLDALVWPSHSLHSNFAQVKKKKNQLIHLVINLIYKSSCSTSRLLKITETFIITASKPLLTLQGAFLTMPMHWQDQNSPLFLGDSPACSKAPQPSLAVSISQSSLDFHQNSSQNPAFAGWSDGFSHW